MYGWGRFGGLKGRGALPDLSVFDTYVSGIRIAVDCIMNETVLNQHGIPPDGSFDGIYERTPDGQMREHPAAITGK